MVDCQQGPTRAVPPAPTESTASWIQDGLAWAAGVLGILEEERALRREEHACIDELRRKGVIR